MEKKDEWTHEVSSGLADCHWPKKSKDTRIWDVNYVSFVEDIRLEMSEVGSLEDVRFFFLE